jgi:hypothetical protein
MFLCHGGTHYGASVLLGPDQTPLETDLPRRIRFKPAEMIGFGIQLIVRERSRTTIGSSYRIWFGCALVLLGQILLASVNYLSSKVVVKSMTV